MRVSPGKSITPNDVAAVKQFAKDLPRIKREMRDLKDAEPMGCEVCEHSHVFNVGDGAEDDDNSCWPCPKCPGGVCHGFMEHGSPCCLAPTKDGCGKRLGSSTKACGYDGYQCGEKTCIKKELDDEE